METYWVAGVYLCIVLGCWLCFSGNAMMIESRLTLKKELLALLQSE